MRVWTNLCFSAIFLMVVPSSPTAAERTKQPAEPAMWPGNFSGKVRADATPVVIVRAGKSNIVIYCPADAPESVKLAAQDVVDDAAQHREFRHQHLGVEDESLFAFIAHGQQAAAAEELINLDFLDLLEAQHSGGFDRIKNYEARIGHDDVALAEPSGHREVARQTVADMLIRANLLRQPACLSLW